MMNLARGTQSVDDTRDFGAHLELFFGQSSDALARVYARLRDFGLQAGEQLIGSLAGPTCVYAATLPARMAFVDRSAGGSPLAEVLVPEPCFWTPEMPQLYQATLELRRDDQVIARAQQTFGIRMLGSAGRKLIYNAKRWVLRAVCQEEAGRTALQDWHQADTAMFVRHPDEALCEQSSRVGVLLVAQLDTAEAQEIRRVSRWPAVGMAVIDARAALDTRRLPPNLLLAASFVAGEPLRPPAWAQVALVNVANRADLAEQLAGCHLPVIASCIENQMLGGLAEGRALCDRLQRLTAGRVDLGGYDFAGYLV
ncbi:MAG TPA: hypothetical protein VHV08_15400 [Pirellulales bacterium]|nr:hypothetical protein [Pirellulales bacterium]